MDRQARQGSISYLLYEGTRLCHVAHSVDNHNAKRHSPISI